MTKVYIAGVAMTKMGRLDGATVKSLTREAVDGAMADAALARMTFRLPTTRTQHSDILRRS
ncbi:hypothetical protein ACFQFQ_30195 [Sulfitobacter porphyrae]|uniref:Thiolase N-terminal domain-containing protein n=1 Tax=Sulfitobacter porphyrae TaxID=1246864 RepID=A0ABW2BC96_9RHOB